MDRAVSVPPFALSEGVALLDSACVVARAMLGAPACFAVLDGAEGLRIAGLSGLDRARAEAILADGRSATGSGAARNP